MGAQGGPRIVDANAYWPCGGARKKNLNGNLCSLHVFMLHSEIFFSLKGGVP